MEKARVLINPGLFVLRHRHCERGTSEAISALTGWHPCTLTRFYKLYEKLWNNYLANDNEKARFV
jgi:hypothetical protein